MRATFRSSRPRALIQGVALTVYVADAVAADVTATTASSDPGGIACIPPGRRVAAVTVSPFRGATMARVDALLVASGATLAVR